MTTTISFSEIKAKNKRGGFFFFEPDTMKFFNSRIEGNIAFVKGNNAYFITSEQRPNSEEPRRYTVRRANLKSGDIETEGDFQEYGKASQAMAEIKRLVG